MASSSSLASNTGCTTSKLSAFCFSGSASSLLVFSFNACLSEAELFLGILNFLSAPDSFAEGLFAAFFLFCSPFATAFISSLAVTFDTDFLAVSFFSPATFTSVFSISVVVVSGLAFVFWGSALAMASNFATGFLAEFAVDFLVATALTADFLSSTLTAGFLTSLSAGFFSSALTSGFFTSLAADFFTSCLTVGFLVSLPAVFFSSTLTAGFFASLPADFFTGSGLAADCFASFGLT